MRASPLRASCDAPPPNPAPQFEPRAVLDALTHRGLTPNQSRLYVYLILIARGRQTYAATTEELMAALHLRDRDATMQGLKRLASLGLIAITRRKNLPNLYRIWTVEEARSRTTADAEARSRT